jgi:hypothetical protein
MFHLNHAKVYAVLKRSYFWPDLQKDTRRVLSDCPECELTKARQHNAHALFHAAPIYAPRSRWCMDFQGQGTALTGETDPRSHRSDVAIRCRPTAKRQASVNLDLTILRQNCVHLWRPRPTAL